MNSSLLSILLAIPLIGAAVLCFIPASQTRRIKVVTFVTTMIALILSLPLYFGYDPSSSGFQFMQSALWISGLNIYYRVGIDGLSVFIVLLTTLLTTLSVLSSWTAIKDRVKEYMILMLLMETAMIGVFVSLDLFLFYVFWEASLIPMALLIGLWGGDRRVYAAVKFVLYTFIASTLMLVALIFLYFKGGTSDLTLLLDMDLGLTQNWQIWLFFAFGLAFAVKVPLFPFHTWLPAAHVQAPTAGSILLAGVLLKMGTYGYLRFANPLLPEGAVFWGPILSVLAVVGIIYGALVALAQEDVKSLIAYSSVAHMGFIILGMYSGGFIGTSGAVMQMINHGLSTGVLFMLVGVIYERRHTRLLKDYGGIFVKVPTFGVCFLLAAFSSVGLPGLNGFVGEFTILLGTFENNITLAVIGTFGIILAAWYLLTAVRGVLFGPLNPDNENLKDMTPRELAAALPLIIFFFILGLFPNLLFSIINPAVEGLVGDGQTEQVASLASED